MQKELRVSRKKLLLLSPLETLKGQYAKKIERDTGLRNK
jgi:hypothetical protein